MKSFLLAFRRGKKSVDTSGYPPDKVVLFQFPRGPGYPSLSPFVLKLETYLRMAGIPYIVSIVVNSYTVSILMSRSTQNSPSGPYADPIVQSMMMTVDDHLYIMSIVSQMLQQ